MYRERFENLFRVVLKITSSLNIADILEIIRDEAKMSIPELQEACLLLIDPDAAHYTRPLRCAMSSDSINCQLCKRGRKTISTALENPGGHLCVLPGVQTFQAAGPDNTGQRLTEVAIPIYHGNEPLAVLDAIAKDDCTLGDKEITLLKDLCAIASNVLTNARRHWALSQERLTLDKILERLRPFVPQTVQGIVEKNPDAPLLDKTEMDVSVLFLDVAGYTRISESLSQEQVNFIIEKYFSSFLDVIYLHGGDINETAGDGLMILFQGPHEENALNAANAAIEVRRRTMEINRELTNRFQPIVINMGVNSGTASVGMSRFQGTTGTRMTFTASGPVTNLAARIASSALNGDILVGPETARRIEGRIAMNDRGLMSFKNVARPVRIFSISEAAVSE